MSNPRRYWIEERALDTLKRNGVNVIRGVANDLTRHKLGIKLLGAVDYLRKIHGYVFYRQPLVMRDEVNE